MIRYTKTGTFTNEFAIQRTEHDIWKFDVGLASRLIKLFQCQSVADWGCGIGKYVDYFTSNGIDCKGYDGISGIADITNGKVLELDFTNPINGFISDWILCIEVGEHIPKEYEFIFLNNLTTNCKKGIVLSWAIPAQLGIGHVNNRSNDCIIRRLRNRGFLYQRFISNDVRNAITFNYLKRTTMVFVRNKILYI